MAMVNGVAQEFWSEVFNLHAPLDEPRQKRAAKSRSKRVRKIATRDTRFARAS